MKTRDIMTIVGQFRSIQCTYPYIVPFLRRLEEAIARKARSNYHGDIRITMEMVKDIDVIRTAVYASKRPMSFEWFLKVKERKVCDVEVYTDAATTIGVGGFVNQDGGGHFQFLWREYPEWNDRHHPDITYMELFGVVLAAKLWGKRFNRLAVGFWCDNWASVMMAIRKVACFHRRDLNDLLRELCQSVMKHDHHYWIRHIPGVKNIIADAISRNEIVPAAAMRQQGIQYLEKQRTDCRQMAIEMLDRTWFKHTHYIQRVRHEKHCHCDTDVNNRYDRTGRIMCKKTNKLIMEAETWTKKEKTNQSSERRRKARKRKFNSETNKQ